MDAVVQVYLFLELSDDEVINDDAAVMVMEDLAATLQRMDVATKERFLQFVRHRAEQVTSSVERETIENLPNALGLLSE
jgi:hypothetical protein